MAQLHQHPDGIVIVRTAAGQYSDTGENFALDYGAPAPGFPEGIVERIYDDEGRHALFDAKGNQKDSGEIPYPVGDSIIAAYDRLVGVQKARQEQEHLAAVAATKAANQLSIPPVVSGGPVTL